MWILLLAVYGLIIGSFINAFVWRFHESHDDDLKPKKLSKKQQAELSIVKGRSMCPSCKHRLSGADLIPVLSWIALSGKCRYCKKPISAQYPIVELITAILFVFSYIAWPYELSGAGIAAFLVWLVIVAGYMTLSVYDIRWQLLPDKIVYPVILFSFLFAVLQTVETNSSVAQSVLGYIGAVTVCSGIFAAIYQISDGRWIGGGDVKLGLSLGLIVGSLVNGLIVIMLASIIGLVVSLPFIAKKNLKMQSKIAFGPMLMIAGYVVVLYGDMFVNWYSINVLYL